MKATIELKRAVAVNAWRFQGDVSVLQPLPWEVAVVKTAVEQGGVISVNDVSRQLLGDRQPIARALLQRCQVFGLLTGDQTDDSKGFQLTDSGKKSAETSEVFVPQSGTWTLWMTEDPMIPDRFLLLERWREPSALDELKQERYTGVVRDFMPAPKWLREMEGKDLNVPLGKYDEVRITKILDQVEHAGDGHLSLKFCLASDPSGTHTFLEGTLRLPDRYQMEEATESKPFKSSPTAVPTSYEECWQALLESEGMTEAWDREERALKVKYPEDEDERRFREGSRHFRFPAIPNLGCFDPATIRNVPLCPASAADAQQWAEWLLRSKVTEFATEIKFQQWSDEAGKPFLKWQPKLPQRTELAAAARPDHGFAHSRMFWHLQTPCDWNL
jgi:hypothetical protein